MYYNQDAKADDDRIEDEPEKSVMSYFLSGGDMGKGQGLGWKILRRERD
jgi:hypothetical protein